MVTPRTLWIVLGLVALSSMIPSAASAQAVEVDDDPPTLSVDVALVNVTATVIDEVGEYVPGLTAEDFSIFENGVEQNVAFFSHDRAVPVSLGIMVDVSGSMRHKLQQALQIARETATALSPQDEVFILTFAEDMNVLTDFTASSPDVAELFRGVRTGGDTHQFDSIALGLRMMENARNQKKVLLLISDGFDSGSRLEVEEAEEMLKRAEVLVYAIGIDDDDSDPEVMRRTRYHVYHYMLNRLTDLTGGLAFRVYTGRRFALRSLSDLLLEELHQQYTLGYYPTSPSSDADWREIEVELRTSELPVRHRPGYYGPEPADE